VIPQVLGLVKDALISLGALLSVRHNATIVAYLLSYFPSLVKEE